MYLKMPRKFLTAYKAMNFCWTLDDSDDSDLVDSENDLVILLPDPNALSDTEEIDYSSTRKIEEIYMWNKPKRDLVSCGYGRKFSF